MKLVAYLEKNNIVTRETLRVFMVTFFSYLLFCVFVFYQLTWWALSSLLIVLGCMSNLYVMDFNKNRMPVNIGPRSIGIARKEYPKRAFCQLTSQTRLSWFADRFPIGKSIYSIGDFMIYFGTTLCFLPFVAGVVFLFFLVLFF